VSIAKVDTQVHRATNRVVLLSHDGDVIATTIRSADADTWLRPRTWEATVDRLTIWLREN
jgi:hypothetical protein